MINFDKVRRVIKDNVEDAMLGIFFTLNITGDRLETLYKEGEVRVDICRGFNYFEVFGLEPKDQVELEKYYWRLVNGRE